MSSPLSIELTAPAVPLQKQDVVILTVAVRHNGEEGLYVNARFAAAPAIGDLQLSVKLDGRELPCLLRIRMASLKAGDFVLLEPGQCLVAGVNLTRLYALNKAGTYTISGQYVSEQVPSELQAFPVFKGRLDAPPVQVRIQD